MRIRPLTVIVDNDEDKRYLLVRKLLREFPFLEVYSFSNIASASELVASPDLALLITNGVVGVEDGLAFIEGVRRERPSLPIIVVTLHSELKERAREVGATRFVLENEPDGIHSAVQSVLAEVGETREEG